MLTAAPNGCNLGHMTPFQQLVKSIGPRKFSKKYGIKETTAISYSMGARVPPPTSPLVHRLIDEGAITFHELYPLRKAS